MNKDTKCNKEPKKMERKNPANRTALINNYPETIIIAHVVIAHGDHNYYSPFVNLFTTTKTNELHQCNQQRPSTTKKKIWNFDIILSLLYYWCRFALFVLVRLWTYYYILLIHVPVSMNVIMIFMCSTAKKNHIEEFSLGSNAPTGSSETES